MDGVISHWSASWLVLAGYVLVAAAHLVGMRRLLATTRADSDGGATAGVAGASGEQLRREAWLFQSALLLMALALVSPMGYLATVYIWVRALQALLVAVVGPGLLVLGAPWPAFAKLRRRAPAQVQGRDDPGAWLVARPVLAVVAFNVVFLGWQVPALYDAARASAGLALLEHVTFVAAGMLLWFQLISSRPFSQRIPPVRRMALLVGTVAASTVLGMVLVFGSRVVYSGYANSYHHVMTVIDDQQLSGAVLWMGMLPPLIVAGVALMLEWFRNEESAELSADLDRLLAPRRHGWPSRPVIR